MKIDKKHNWQMTNKQLSIAEVLALNEFKKPVHERQLPREIVYLAKRIAKRLRP